MGRGGVHHALLTILLIIFCTKETAVKMISAYPIRQFPVVFNARIQSHCNRHDTAKLICGSLQRFVRLFIYFSFRCFSVFGGSATPKTGERQIPSSDCRNELILNTKRSTRLVLYAAEPDLNSATLGIWKERERVRAIVVPARHSFSVHLKEQNDYVVVRSHKQEL